MAAVSRAWGLGIMVLAGAAGLAEGATVTVLPDHDNSIYSESNASNGAGVGVFAGVTANGGVRRGLLSFNLAAAGVPAGATVTGVSLGLTQTKIGPGAAATFELHRLTAAWGEGTSNGTGAGNTATPGDATWNYRLFNTNTWATPGGDFAAAISGSTSLGTANGLYTFATTPTLVADVQGWLNSPGTNFGWLLKAATETGTSAREFGSREGGAASAASLTITYNVPEPAAGLTAIMATFVALRRRRRAGNTTPDRTGVPSKRPSRRPLCGRMWAAECGRTPAGVSSRPNGPSRD